MEGTQRSTMVHTRRTGVTTFPNLVWGATSNLESTIAKGDFSGTVMDVFDTPHSISGSFDAIRVQ